MKVIAAIDSYKGSLSSIKAGYAVREGIKRVFPEAKVAVLPLADGGEGTIDAIISGMGGEFKKITVTGPLGKPVTCRYGILRKKKTAVIEMAAAAGITLLSEKELNPFHTTTYGVGEIIRDAIEEGLRKFIVGIGGSATNDGGAGMLMALGFSILNSEGKEICPGAKGLSEIASISEERVIPELSECEFKIACDVSNPLYGETGASYIYGPQKGATPEMVKAMDLWMKHYAKEVKKVRPKANPEAAGSGAAGGLGFAFLSFTNASLIPGVKLILKEIGLEEEIEGCDFVITGEGRLDFQTVMGKAPIGVAALAKKHGIPVIAFSGIVKRGARVCNERGIDAYFPILRNVVSLKEAMDPEESRRNLEDTAEQVFRLIKICRN